MARFYACDSNRDMPNISPRPSHIPPYALRFSLELKCSFLVHLSFLGVASRHFLRLSHVPSSAVGSVVQSEFNTVSLTLGVLQCGWRILRTGM